MQFTYMLAPIEGVSENAFRTLCYKNGADITFTEMARVDALARGNKSTWDRISLLDSTPTAIQLLALKEGSLEKFLAMFKPQEGFKGFNLNLGCPSPNIIKTGMGCAMIKRVNKTNKLVKIIKSKGYEVSIKLRLGMNLFEKQNKNYLNLIKEADADYFIVHARHGMQTYEEPADNNIYLDCVETGKAIIANGDIKTEEQAKQLRKAGVMGVMIGRAAVKDPAIFNRIKGKHNLGHNEIRNDYLRLTETFNTPQKHKEMFLSYFENKKEFGKILI